MFSVKQHDQRSLSWWHQQFRAEKLDMDPPYQRRAEIWSQWKRAHLIDSILNDYDIPKFYIGDFVRARSQINNKMRPYSVIDGKQRFAAIFEFFDDGFPLNISSRLEAEPRLAIGGLSYSQLKANFPTIAAKIADFEPVIMSVVTDDAEKIPELFVRLNSGESVNRAERRNALPGIIPRMIADLTVHPFFQQRIRFNIRRMQDFNLAAKLLFVEYSKGFVDTKANDLDSFAKLGIKPSGETKEALVGAETRAQEVLERLALVFKNNDPLLSSQGNIPIYYWALRQHPGTKGKFRAFVEEFTQEIRDNLQLSRVDPDGADSELSLYYTMGRTTNDAASLSGRYKIFYRRLQEFSL